MSDKILSTISLAFKAGFVKSGEEQVCISIKKKNIYYVFLANDAGVNTKKRIMEKCAFYNCPLNTDFSSSQLSQAIGKENRMVIGIANEGFAKLMKEKR